MVSFSHQRRLGRVASHIVATAPAAATQEEVDVAVETQAAIVR